MPLEDDVVLFTKWAAELGCPLQFIPNEESQKSILRAKRNLVFHNLVSKTRPMQEVTIVRQNILLARDKIQSYSQKDLIAVSAKQQLPIHLQRFHRHNKIQQKICDTKERIHTYKSQFHNVAKMVKVKSIVKLKLLQELNDIQAKHAIYAFKEQNFKTNVDNERQNRMKLQRIMPVRPTSTNQKQEDRTNQAIFKCMQLFNAFNQMFVTTTDTHTIKDARGRMWEQIHHQLANIPNATLWNALMERKEKQLEDIKTISMDLGGKNKITNGPLIDDKYFEKAISQLHTKHIIRLMKIKVAINESHQLRNEYDPIYEHFTEVLETKINLVNEYVDKDVLDEFIIQFITNAYQNGQMFHLRKDVDKIKRQLDTKSASSNNTLITELLNIYQEINSTFRRMQDEIIQLYQMKDKINYVKSMTNYLVQNIRPAPQANLTITNLNRTVMNNSSFMSNDSMFCSTKIGTFVDFDSTLRLIDHGQLSCTSQPAFAVELLAFNEMPVARLQKWKVEEIVNYQLNPLVTLFCEDTGTLELLPFHPLTITGTLQQIKVMFEWDLNVRQHMKDVAIDFDVCEVNRSKLKRLDIENTEGIAELLDQVAVASINSKLTIVNIQKYYNFIVTNPLQNYIPLSELFNGRTYREYEAEYKMYYRILKGAAPAPT